MHSQPLGGMDPPLNGMSCPGVICGEGTSPLGLGLVASALAAPPSRNSLGQNPHACNPLLVKRYLWGMLALGTARTPAAGRGDTAVCLIGSTTTLHIFMPVQETCEIV